MLGYRLLFSPTTKLKLKDNHYQTSCRRTIYWNIKVWNIKNIKVWNKKWAYFFVLCIYCIECMHKVHYNVFQMSPHIINSYTNMNTLCSNWASCKLSILAFDCCFVPIFTSHCTHSWSSSFTITVTVAVIVTVIITEYILL